MYDLIQLQIPLGAVLKFIMTYIRDYFLPREKEFESRSLAI